ncbi:nuclear receptor-binding factor 2b isoform 1-T1 [Synchiropus picturatus]
MKVLGVQSRFSCHFNPRRLDSMEVVDSPLNLAHQQCRKADRLLAAGKFEEAISCHGKAADLLTNALKKTGCEQQARLSMELQRDSHIKQQRLIQERWKREARRQMTKAQAVQGTPSSSPALVHQSPASGPLRESCAAGAGMQEREYDTLLYQLQIRQAGSIPPQIPCPGSKVTKDDKTRLEEQQTTIEYLRSLVDQLINKNLELVKENKQLKLENARLRSEEAEEELEEHADLWMLSPAEGIMGTIGGAQRKATDQESDSPVPMPTEEDLCDLPPLELPNLNELQEILEKDKL